MSTAKKTWTTGERLNADDLNGNFEGYKTSINCGESITAPAPVCIVNDVFQKQVQNLTFSFGDSTNTMQYGISFKPYSTVMSSSVKIIIGKTGSPSDNVTVEIQSDSGGSPSGTAITNGTSNNVAGTSITTNAAVTTFTFGSSFTLSADTTYWIVLKRSGSSSGTNYYKVYYSANDYANFVGKVKLSGGSWTSSSGVFYAQIVPSSGSSISAWRSDANIIGLDNCHGYLITNGTASNNSDIQMNGVVSGLSSLTVGEPHFVQDSVGTLGTSRGTRDVYAGKALSATEMDINRLMEFQRTRYLSGSASSATGTTDETITIYTGFRPQVVTMSASLLETLGGEGTKGISIVMGGASGASFYYRASAGAVTSSGPIADGGFTDSSITLTIQNITDISFDILVDKGGIQATECSISWGALG